VLGGVKRVRNRGDIRGVFKKAEWGEN
jgi:hypothetical protein